MTEIEAIARIAKLAGRHRHLVAGIGDDCAIYRPRPGEDLLFTTDLLAEDVHFERATHSPEDVGHKALARGLSDIAAMGGAPRFCLVSLALPEWADREWLDRFYKGGLLRLAKQAKTALAGGDLGRAAKLVCDIVVCGAVPRGKALRRDTARAGDAIYVSGALGGSALGLATRRGRAWERHRRPLPRLALGAALRERFHATACMDLSDGLSIDLHRMALASGLCATLDAPPPAFPGASLEQALHGGEDYELLFTLRPGAKAPRAAARIGAMRAGLPGRVTLLGTPLPVRGYDHLRRDRGQP